MVQSPHLVRRQFSSTPTNTRDPADQERSPYNPSIHTAPPIRVKLKLSGKQQQQLDSNPVHVPPNHHGHPTAPSRTSARFRKGEIVETGEIVNSNIAQLKAIITGECQLSSLSYYISRTNSAHIVAMTHWLHSACFLSSNNRQPVGVQW
eukprot:sb/3473642/